MTAVDTNAARTIARHDQCPTCDGEGCPDCYHTGLTPLANVTLALCNLVDALTTKVDDLDNETARLRAALATIAFTGCTPVANRTAPALCWSITDDQADWCPSCYASHTLWVDMDAHQ